jgi:hypothetical protein
MGGRNYCKPLRLAAINSIRELEDLVMIRSRIKGVLTSRLYFPPGSLKLLEARLCGKGSVSFVINLRVVVCR